MTLAAKQTRVTLDCEREPDPARSAARAQIAGDQQSAFVAVLDGDAYGTQVTFCLPSPDGQSPKWVPKVTEYAVNRNLDGSVRGTSENGIPRPATPDEIP